VVVDYKNGVIEKMFKSIVENKFIDNVILLSILFFMVLSFYPSYSADSPISVSVEPVEVGVGEMFEVLVVINGSNIEEPKFIPVEGVRIDPNPTYSGMSTQVQIMFGKTQIVTTKERRFRGTADKEGEWTIQVKAKVDGKEYTSDPVVLKVSKSATPKVQPPTLSPFQQRKQLPRRSSQSYSTQPRSVSPVIDNSLIVESEVSKKLIYQGEIIYLTLRAKIIDLSDISIRTPTGNIPDPPDLSNFFVGKAEHSTRTETINNYPYKVMEHKIPICPKGVGTFKISPWVWDASVVYYGNWGWPESYSIRKETEPISIEVRPLPSSPPNYYGAVGKFNITANISGTDVEVGTPLYLTLTITGEGYPEFVKPPEIKGLDWAYVSGPEVQSVNSDSWNAIEKSFKYTISPMKSGDFKIDSIEYAYFNPQLGQYATLKTTPFNIRVKQSSDNAVITAGGAPRLETQTLDVSKPELLPLVTESTRLKPSKKTGITSKVMLIIVPPLISSLMFLGGIRRQSLLNNPALLRKRNAYRNALKKYEELRKTTSTPLAVENGLKQYIGDMLGLENPLGMTSDEISDILFRCVQNVEIIERVRKILKTCERLRYAGEKETSLNEDKGLEDAFREVIETLRKSIK